MCVCVCVHVCVPGDEGAVVYAALLYVDAHGGVGLDPLPVLVPEEMHVGGHQRGMALQGQRVPLEHHLLLGRAHLERGQLQRQVCTHTHTGA